MKLFLIAGLISVCTNLIFAGVQMNLKDEKLQNEIKAYEERAKLDNFYSAFTADARLKILKGANISSFQDIVNLVKATFEENKTKYEKLKFYDLNRANKFIINLSENIATWFEFGDEALTLNMKKEALNSMMLTSNFGLIQRMISQRSKYFKQMPNEFQLTVLKFFLENFNSYTDDFSVSKLSSDVDLYIECANKANVLDNEVKTFLKKLNRKYTIKLLEDKTKFEAVVAKIRSLLETY